MFAFHHHLPPEPLAPPYIVATFVPEDVQPKEQKPLGSKQL